METRSHIDDDVDGERDAVSITTFCVAGVVAIFDDTSVAMQLFYGGNKKNEIVQLKIPYEIIKKREKAPVIAKVMAIADKKRKV